MILYVNLRRCVLRFHDCLCRSAPSFRLHLLPSVTSKIIFKLPPSFLNVYRYMHMIFTYTLSFSLYTSSSFPVSLSLFSLFHFSISYSLSPSLCLFVCLFLPCLCLPVSLSLILSLFLHRSTSICLYPSFSQSPVLHLPVSIRLSLSLPFFASRGDNVYSSTPNSVIYANHLLLKGTAWVLEESSPTHGTRDAEVLCW